MNLGIKAAVEDGTPAAFDDYESSQGFVGLMWGFGGAIDLTITFEYGADGGDVFASSLSGGTFTVSV